MSLTTALIYTRVSSDEQARDGLSLDTQLSECQRYSARNDWILGATYTDIVTGTRDNRPQYQQLLADVRQLRAQRAQITVVVAALDRFDRRLIERIRCRDELKSLGVAVHSVREGGEVSDLVANVLGAVAQEEVRRLGERVHAAKQYVREHGFMPTGNCPWGYRWRPATELERLAGAPKSVLDIDDITAPYVREAFDRAETISLRKLGRWLHELPAEALGGRRMAISSLARAIGSPTYIARDPNATGDVLAYPVMRWPALVDDDLWLRVKQAIADHTIHHRQASGRYLLTGFLRCPSCGGRIAGRWSAGRQRRYYQCNHERATGEGTCQWTGPAPSLEEPVLEQIRDLVARSLVGGQVASRARQRWRGLQQPGELEGYREQRVIRLRHDADRARERLTNAAVMLVDGQLDRGGYELVRDASQGELRAAEEEIARLSGTITRTVLPDFAEVFLALGQWAQILDGGLMDQQREVLAALITRIDGTRLSYGRYSTSITWTPLGEALLLVAGRRTAVGTGVV